jgi:subtilisin family serine protease
MKRLIRFTLCLFLWPAASNAATYLAEYQDAAQASSAVRQAGGTVLHSFDEIDVLAAESDAPDFAAKLKASRAFTAVAKDRLMQRIAPPLSAGGASVAPIGAASSDPTGAACLGSQWNLAITKTEEAWALTRGHPDVKVAVLDSGYCAHHVDTIGKIDKANSKSFWTETVPECAAAVAACPTCPDWEDYYGHGTLVASVISTNNVLTAGAAPNITLRVIKTSGCDPGDFTSSIAGFLYAVATGNNIVNISSTNGVLPYDKSDPDLGTLWGMVTKVVNYAHTRGVLVVAAAGNSGLDLDHLAGGGVFPCQVATVFCVGATTISDQLAPYSNHGVSRPQMVAPGGDETDLPASGIIGPCPPHLVVGFDGSLFSPPNPCTGSEATGVVFDWGTSYASPLAAAAAALVDSVAPRGPGTLTPSQMRSRLLQGADDLGTPGTDRLGGEDAPHDVVGRRGGPPAVPNWVRPERADRG